MPQVNYEERKRARIERLKERAEKADTKSEQLHKESSNMMQAIPMGQPILVGHHSEQADRRYRERAWNKMGRAVAESEKADHLRNRATAAASNRAISSDDPEAVTLLQAKIDKAERHQERMREANRIVRRKPKNEATEDKISDLVKLCGITEGTAHKLFGEDFCGRAGFQSYELQNNNANIRRMKLRIEELRQAETLETKETEHEGFSVVENAEENRIQVLFDSKQAYMDLCKSKGINLRRMGWKYSKYNNAWQRHLNGAGRHAVRMFLAEIAKAEATP